MNTPKPRNGTPVVASVRPGPVPMDCKVATATVGDKQMVYLEIATVTGTATYFIDHQTAEGIGKAMVKNAHQARSGLAIVDTGKLIL